MNLTAVGSERWEGKQGKEVSQDQIMEQLILFTRNLLGFSGKAPTGKMSLCPYYQKALKSQWMSLQDNLPNLSVP